MQEEKVIILETIDFEKSIYEYRSDGIVIITVKDDSHVVLEDTLKQHRESLKRPDYLPMRVLIRPGKNTSISKEVREFVNREDAKALIKCQAIIVDSLAHKIIANFMMKLYKQPNEFKVFDKEEEGIQWLKDNA